MNLKCNLKWLIAKSGMNQDEVAEKMGMSKQWLSNVVNGRIYPRIDKAIKLGKIINTDISEFYEELNNSGVTEKEEI